MVFDHSKNFMKKYYVYLLECADKSIYTGSTSDLKKRIDQHSNQKGAKYTKYRLPVKLIYSESYDTLLKARRRESEIKGWSRDEKLQLIK